MKKQLLFGFISCIFFCTTCLKVNAQTPYDGIPYGFVPASLSELANLRWAQMAYGTTFGNPGAVLGPHPSGTTHRIIETPSWDPNTCSATGIQLRTLPDINVIPDWDVENDGPLRVMRLGDATPANPLGSQVTYSFKPDSVRNVIVVYFAFIAENPTHTYDQNPTFTIEVLRANGQRINGGAKSSYFMVNPKGSSPANNPNSHDEILEKYDSYKLCGTIANGRQWSSWLPVAFDLKDYKGQEVRLRISTQDCSPQGHYAYGYYTVRGASGNVDVTSCGNTNIKLAVPSGFHEYAWTINGIQEYNPTYEMDRPRNSNDTAISCTATSKNGASMTFTTVINYYELNPDFEWEIGGGNCQYDVQFTNTSELNIVNGGKPTPQEVKDVVWDFGDGSETSKDISPFHQYADKGTYTVSLTLYDNDGKCDSTITKEIVISEVFGCSGKDTLHTCSENFPYTSPKYPGVVWDAPGDDQEVTYEGACVPSGCDSIVTVTVLGDLPHGERDEEIIICKDKFPYDYAPGYSFKQEGIYDVKVDGDYDNDICDSIIHVHVKVQNPQVDIRIVGDFCNDFAATLVAETKSQTPQYLWSNGMAMPELPITEPGIYSVEMTDDLGCIATNKYKVPACLPYITLPNSFSPSNKDGLNDYFELPQTSLIQKLELAIYDRYGTLVYYTDRKDFKWDGVVNNNIYYNATYIYILVITDYNDITTRHTGSITTL